jgi:hypothetical protein
MLEKHLTQKHTPRRSAFVSINLDPDLPPKKLYSNLRQLGVINGSDKVEVEVDVERMNQFS